MPFKRIITCMYWAISLLTHSVLYCLSKFPKNCSSVWIFFFIFLASLFIYFVFLNGKGLNLEVCSNSGFWFKTGLMATWFLKDMSCVTLRSSILFLQIKIFLDILINFSQKLLTLIDQFDLSSQQFSMQILTKTFLCQSFHTHVPN